MQWMPCPPRPLRKQLPKAQHAVCAGIPGVLTVSKESVPAPGIAMR